jgi:TRAP-type C4-dicarboxylate transport system substrate-binding protein
MFVIEILEQGFIDGVCSNIGNARIAGLQKSLKMTNHQYSVALTVT